MAAGSRGGEDKAKHRDVAVQYWTWRSSIVILNPVALNDLHRSDRHGSPFIGHPYIPNSVPSVKRRMLDIIGAEDVDELYRAIPSDLRLRGDLDLPPPILSEQELRNHVQELLQRNLPTTKIVSFLGAGCYPHYVPAICDEINQRNEFLTAYSGSTYEDHGRHQALFEYQSLMAELLEMDVVSLPTYDGDQSAATGLRMAGRATDRRRVLVASSISPDRLARMMDYCRPALMIEMVPYDAATGILDLEYLESRLADDVAAVYFEHPSFFGTFETAAPEIVDAAHRVGALAVVAVDPILLGVVVPPARFGADIVVGDIQALGVHMQYGGGQAGFIATADDPDLVHEYPVRILSMAPTSVPGEVGFGDTDHGRTSFVRREHGKEWMGTTANLWGITAAVYLSLMGPHGMRDLGRLILSNARYAMERIGSLPGIKAPRFTGPHGKEFVVDFGDTGRTVKELNDALLDRGIHGGLDLEKAMGLDACALYCVTEIHTKEQIDQLVDALREEIT